MIDDGFAKRGALVGWKGSGEDTRSEPTFTLSTLHGMVWYGYGIAQYIVYGKLWYGIALYGTIYFSWYALVQD